MTQIEIKISDNISVFATAKNLTTSEELHLFSKVIKANENIINQINNVVEQFEKPKSITVTKEINLKNLINFNKSTFRINTNNKLDMFNTQFGTNYKHIQQIYNKINYYKKLVQ